MLFKICSCNLLTTLCLCPFLGLTFRHRTNQLVQKGLPKIAKKPFGLAFRCYQQQPPQGLGQKCLTWCHICNICLGFLVRGFQGLVRAVSFEISPHFLCFFSSMGMASKMGNMKGNLFFKVGFVFRTWKARKKKGLEIKCAREK